MACISYKELKGPKDKHEAKYTVVVKLLEPVKARYIRFIPTSAQSPRVMRAELYGCMAEPMPPYDGKFVASSYSQTGFSQKIRIIIATIKWQWKKKNEEEKEA